MAAFYKQFLASPSSSLLADDASLAYVPTATFIKGSAEIIKHLGAVSKQVRKKKEDILNTVDGQINAAFEVDTALEFLISGGPYLSVVNMPKLDDNLICDRVVYLPIHHFVNFSEDGKISQIRLAWDQGALLKQVEVIGKSGLNWPIKDGREQVALIQSCLKAAGVGPPVSASDHKEVLIRTRGNSTNALRDPHASLHMQLTREERENTENSEFKSPYAVSKRPQRGFADILGDDPEGKHYDDRNAMSPTKIGGGKNYQPMRIFDGQDHVEEEEEASAGRPVSQYIRPNANKYKHFDLADGSDPADAPKPVDSSKPRPKSKHDSQWDFADFTTPAKLPNKPFRAQEVRHWDTDKDALGEETPALQGKGRRDAEVHFELQDDGEQVPRQNRGTNKGSMQNDGHGLYKNKYFDEDEQGEEPSHALGNITNLKGRGNDFGAHWQMTDDSPDHSSSQRQGVPKAHQQAVKTMEANWSSYDESPKQKENTRLSEQHNDTKINIAGDGMGGRKGTTRNWLYGEDDEAPANTSSQRQAAPQAHQKAVKSMEANWSSYDESPKPKATSTRPARPTEQQDTTINIAGDGMGGRKGATRHWIYGEDNEEADAPRPAPKGRGGHTAQQNSLWDF